MIGKSTECYMMYDVKNDYLSPAYAGSYHYVLGELEEQLGEGCVARRLQEGEMKIVKVSVTVLAESE